MDSILIVAALAVILAAVAGYLAGALSGRARTTVAETRAERLPLVEGRLQEAEQQLSVLNAQIAGLNTQLTQERSQNGEKMALLQSARDELTSQFKNLANEILEEKSKRFSEQNQQSLGQLLEPLKSRLQEFQGKVEQVYVQEGKDRSALAEQVRQLMELNRTVSQEANNLTRALKGSNKTQGNWGELILERVLETAGLRKGEEFDVQESHTTGDGKRLQPDVVLHLPEDRHLVIDAKATLVAYEDYANAEDDKHREAALKRHLDAVRAHIKGLSDKNYQDLYGLKSLDFVLMFIPIEPAFMLAVTHDRELFMDAWNKNVLLVSPSTLLFVVRTVASLWRQEAQNRNAQEIAKRGAELYDKLSGFVEDMESLGNRLKQAQDNYDTAFGKLYKGKGNAIRQAEMLKKLGVKPNKSLPNSLVDSANDAADME
ncbi:MAG: DNA recombination protein RmuC [Rhodocyclaceae bacterium]|nr:DNA recombination protein RmuC [Rhodocyclaceae bacterium]